MARAVNRQSDTEAAASVSLEALSGTPITIDGRVYHVGKQNLNQLAAIARIALESMARMTVNQRAEMAKIAESAGKDATQETVGNVQAVLALLDEDALARVAGVVLREEDSAWVNEHIGAVEIMDIVDALFDHNEVPKVVSSFLRLVRRFRALQATTSEK